jgi:hypothetical protein
MEKKKSKRCSGCAYYSEDNTCLMKNSELKENCPKRELVGKEYLDSWMDNIES